MWKTFNIDWKNRKINMRVAIIGTYPPRQCGIATFTHDLFRAMVGASHSEHAIIAVSDGSEMPFPEEVAFVIQWQDRPAYAKAAQYINAHFDACIIQHEYGIFGGDDGVYIVDLLTALNVPVATNLHTILNRPSTQQHHVTQQLLRYSDRVTVMTDRAIRMLHEVYRIDKAKVRKIPHGTPTFTYEQNRAKKALGFHGKRLMLSFGFLGRNKGFETAIDAMAQINHPDFVYVILGQTHPNVKKVEGESYRDELKQRVRTLGLTDRVLFVDSFATEDLLVQYLTACDIYVSPYPNKDQISSGTLTFALGAGAVVISTPYWYAQDLLSEGRGLLFGFRDADRLASTVNVLLENPLLLAHFRARAKAYGQQLAWSNIGARHLALLTDLCSPMQREEAEPIPLETPRKRLIATIFSTNDTRLSS